MSVKDDLLATIGWAQQIRGSLKPLLDRHGDRVHFRPSSKGFAMVGLLHDKPQRGKSGLTDFKLVTNTFEAMFKEHCGEVDHEKSTPEKALQSYFIRESHANNRRLHSINVGSKQTNEPVELVFVTDEISLRDESGKMVCDLLALRRDGGRCTPVVLELKSERALKELKRQVEGYSTLVEAHKDLFAKLFGALLDEEIQFDGRPTEKWIVWPASGAMDDPREVELLDERIRVVTYKEEPKGVYEIRVGQSATA